MHVSGHFSTTHHLASVVLDVVLNSTETYRLLIGRAWLPFLVPCPCHEANSTTRPVSRGILYY